jgi:nucleotide-binding universal stress UspA family protein
MTAGAKHKTDAAPIVAAVDGSRAGARAVETAVDLARWLDAPIVFVHVRDGPSGFLGTPVYQRRLTAALARGRRALDRALEVAAAAGVDAEGEILESSPRRGISELARSRGARLVVVGSRRRKTGLTVSRGVARSAGPPVVVAHALRPLESAA